MGEYVPVGPESAFEAAEKSDAYKTRSKLGPSMGGPFRVLAVDTNTKKFVCDGL